MLHSANKTASLSRIGWRTFLMASGRVGGRSALTVSPVRSAAAGTQALTPDRDSHNE